MKWEWTSFGGSDSVTGSQHLLSSDEGQILLECGLFQGNRQLSWQRNHELNYSAQTLKACILSHAHIDHSGKLPFLVKSGFRGPIFCTPQTAELVLPILEDSAHIMEDDYRYLKRKNRHVLPPLYNKEDVKQLSDLIQAVDYEEPVEVVKGTQLCFFRSAHILGAATVYLSKNGNDLLFTGDLGQELSPFLRPWTIPPVPLKNLFLETTYGGRCHKPFDETLESLSMEIKRVQETGGKIIIPAFAMERTQMLLALLNEWIDTGIIKAIPIYMDSPLGIRMTEIYERNQDSFKKPFRLRHRNPFKSEHIHIMETVQQSMSINQIKGPMIIISSSGMCEGGRVLHHILNNCEDRKNTIMIVGYQAKNTLGRRIVERKREINIFGIKRPLHCRVKALNGFSSHADQDDLLSYIAQFDRSLKNIFLLHGEKTQQESFTEVLQHRYGTHFNVHKLTEGTAFSL